MRSSIIVGDTTPKSDSTRLFCRSLLRGLVFFGRASPVFFIWSFLLCKRLFVALVILKSVVVCVGFVRSGENKKETDLGCLILNLQTVGGWIVFI